MSRFSVRIGASRHRATARWCADGHRCECRLARDEVCNYEKKTRINSLLQPNSTAKCAHCVRLCSDTIDRLNYRHSLQLGQSRRPRWQMRTESFRFHASPTLHMRVRIHARSWQERRSILRSLQRRRKINENTCRVRAEHATRASALTSHVPHDASRLVPSALASPDLISDIRGSLALNRQ